MKFGELRASADLVGRRIWVSWEYSLEPLETPGDLPDMLIRRKERDYDFPPLVPGDPYLLYDSAVFPPAPVPGTLEVLDLPAWESEEGGARVTASTISVVAVAGGVRQEVFRRVRHLVFGTDGAPVRVRFEILDAGGLEPRTPYYYEADDGSVPLDEEVARYRAMAVPGATHGLNRRFYEMLPEVYKRHDVRLLPPEHEFPGVPEASPAGGQLRRFVDMFGMGLDSIRSSAENLLDIHDGYRTQARFLPPLSRMIGWEPTSVFGIPVQRNELLTATRLFDVVGTVPALRALVTHQTRWHSQVAEFAQHVVRANESPRRSVFGVEERIGAVGPAWQGLDDAGSLLAFPPGGAVGFGTSPAVLTSGAVEPFALRAGMELTITVDGDIPARVRFGPDDFDDIGSATAAEISAAISAAFDVIAAQDVGGAVELRTHAVGPEASVEVEVAATSMVAVNDAPQGPLSAFTDESDRIRVFYEQRRDPGRPEQATFPGHRAKTNGNGTAARAEAAQRRIILYKSWGYGEWRDERELPTWTGEPTAPYATPLNDHRIWLGWTDMASSPEHRLRYAVGEPRDATPAVITGSTPEPFPLQVGMQLTVTGSFGSEVFSVMGADYVDPANATAAELVAAMTAQLAQVTASSVAGGAIRLSTVATGTDARLRVDLSQSTAARPLGLASRSLSGQGRWDTEVDWGERGLHMPLVWAPVAHLSAVRDPLGGARVFWSEHHGGRWELRQAHWSERLTVVTPAGVAQRTHGPWQTWVMADGLPSDDVRTVAVDANGTLWFGTPAGLASRRPDNVWNVLTTVDGLSDDEVRDLAFLPNGGLWCATPAGVSVLDAGGAFTVLTAAGTGLIHDDVRAVATDGAGNAWAATPVGVSRLGADEIWESWTAADGLSTGAPRGMAVAPGGGVAVATALGLSIYAEGSWTTYTVADGLAGNDVRAVAWGGEDRLFAATGSGLSIWDGHRWQTTDTSMGLPTNDLLDIAVAPDGRLVVGTGIGLMMGRDRTWTVQDTADGLPVNQIVGVHTTWSSPLVLADAPGGHREPRAAVDGADRTWLVWAGREEAAAGLADTWTIRLRRFDPGAAVWGWEPESAVTTSPGGTSDREPSLEPDAGGGFRVFFSSDRDGGPEIWWLTLDSLGAPGPLASFPNDASESTAPVAVTGPTGQSWLFYRSDRSLVPSQVGMLPGLDAPLRSSERVPDAGALRLRAGCRTVRLGHAARNLGRRRWGDLFTYTPEYPHLMAEDVSTEDHLYTRRTIGLYLRQGRTGHPITQEEITRLLQLLRRFLPINLRVVLTVAPDPLVEFVYTEENDITDAWQDNIPFVDVLDGLSDATEVSVPGMVVLITNDVASLTADVADLTTLRRRTWFPDLL